MQHPWEGNYLNLKDENAMSNSALDFFKLLSCNQPDAEYVICQMVNKKPRRVASIKISKPDETKRILAKWQEQDGMYFVINPMNVSAIKVGCIGGYNELSSVTCAAWDIDVTSKDAKYPPRELVLEVLGDLSVKFGALAESNTNGGLYPFLLLKEPLEKGADGDKIEQFKSVVATVHTVMADRFAAQGFAIDAKPNLTRLLRLPGSRRNYGGQVGVLEISGDSHSINDLVGLFCIPEFISPVYPDEPQADDGPIGRHLTSIGLNTVGDVLEAAGWRVDDDCDVWHPGAKSGAKSGMLFEGRNGQLGMTVKTSGAPGLVQGSWYSREHAWVALHHAGDWAKASVACGTTAEQDFDPVEPTDNRIKSVRVNTKMRTAGTSWLSHLELRTENELATRFIDCNERKLRYVVEWNKWVVWTGKHWQIDDGQTSLLRLARTFSESLWEDFRTIASGPSSRDELISIRSFCKTANKNNGIGAYLHLARADVRITVRVADLNTHPYLLNLRNGTYCLEQGQLLPHRQEDLLTQIANVAYDEKASAPKWIDTLNLIFGGDAGLIRYVQQLLGYSLSGDTGEHILPVCYGLGCNGKSTVWNVVLSLMGDFCGLANDSLLMGMKDNHPTEKAFLYQKRFVAISEPEQSAQLKESRVKELTGDGTITARRMKEDFWSFPRTHTFWLSTNHLPRIKGNDDGIWRRVKLIPFLVDLRKVTTPIPDLDKILVDEEGPGILNWLLAGYRDFKRNGFVEPPCVTAKPIQADPSRPPVTKGPPSRKITSDAARGTAENLYFHS